MFFVITFLSDTRALFKKYYVVNLNPPLGNLMVFIVITSFRQIVFLHTYNC
jgi:hypothetical protein